MIDLITLPLAGVAYCGVLCEDGEDARAQLDELLACWLLENDAIGVGAPEYWFDIERMAPHGKIMYVRGADWREKCGE